MKISRSVAAVLAALLVLPAAVSCKHGSSSSSQKAFSNEEAKNIGKIVVTSPISKEVDVNDTGFTLNRVIDAGAQTEEGEHYIYLDITVKNTTSKDYNLSTLNNFYLLMPDKTEVSSGVRSQVYAVNNFSDRYFGSPFEIKANSTFNGIIGGFVLKEGQDTFTVCFFPTRENRNDNESVIKVDVTPADIVSVPAELKK